MAQLTSALLIQPTEREWTAQVVTLLHLHGFLCAHFRPARRADGTWATPVSADGAGFPDIVATRGPGPTADQPARCLFIELKTERGRLEPLQRRWLDALGSVPGVECYVFKPSMWDEVVEVLT